MKTITTPHPVLGEIFPEICFTAKELVFQLKKEDYVSLRQMVNCDRILQEKLNEVLLATSIKEYSQRIHTIYNYTENMLVVFQQKEASLFPDKKSIEEKLQKLKSLLKQLL